ncbi:MAG: GTP-binding protein [Cyanobacteria bacterium]|jgi:small GTP-binding protein|nr:GTP-binding protein [Cyanobacteria bacterium GSL.Bin1]
MSIPTRKICLVGDFAVGKTSLIRRFVDRQFSDDYLSTVGVKISRKKITFFSDQEISPKTFQLIIWDIEGQTKFRNIAPSYLQGAKGAILVADVSRPQTIDHLLDHQKLFFSINPEGQVAIALNKSDLLTAEELDTLLNQTPIVDPERVLKINLTSAKTGKQVDHLFQVLASGIA